MTILLRRLIAHVQVVHVPRGGGGQHCLHLVTPVMSYATSKHHSKRTVPLHTNHSQHRCSDWLLAFSNLNMAAGDCWAFASTEGVEAINTLAGNGAQTLSPQQVSF